eukprot:7387851-Prymnesium_polylepis.1
MRARSTRAASHGGASGSKKHERSRAAQRSAGAHSDMAGERSVRPPLCACISGLTIECSDASQPDTSGFATSSALRLAQSVAAPSASRCRTSAAATVAVRSAAAL